MKWTEEQTVNFVKEYVKHECLYNANYDEYRNKYVRKAALAKLSASMRLPDFGPRDAYLKIRSLKATYFQEIKKIKDRSDANTGYIYTPKVKWFTILHDALMAASNSEPCRDIFNFEADFPRENYEAEQDLVQENDSDSNEEVINNSNTGCQLDNLHRDTSIKKKRKLTIDYNNLVKKVQCTSNAN